MKKVSSIIKTLKKVKLYDSSSSVLVQKTTRNGKANVYKDIHKNFYFLDKTLTSNSKYYSEKYHKFNPVNKSWIREFKGKKFKSTRVDDNFRRLKIFKKYLKNKKILDFGCGFGEFANTTKKISKETCVFEKSDICKKFIKRKFKKIKIINTLNKYNNYFDSIFMIHTFHYLDRPLDYLINIKKKLKKKGKIILEVPHSNDILLSKYKIQEFREFTFCIESLILHSKLTLLRFLKRSGFKNIKFFYFQRYNLSNHFGWIIKKKPGGHRYFKNLFNVKQQKMYEKFLVDNNLTDTLIVIGEK